MRTATDGETEAHHQHLRRFSGSLGADAAPWRTATGLAATSVYANFGSTFQPPQIDVGPGHVGGLSVDWLPA
jgi:hypothetical protein